MRKDTIFAALRIVPMRGETTGVLFTMVLPSPCFPALAVAVVLSFAAEPGFPDTSPSSRLPAEKPLTDRHGDPLPPGAIARLGTARLRHASQVIAVRYSSDGKYLASRGFDRTVRLWQPDTGKEVFRWNVPKTIDSNAGVVFSPDGKLFAFNHAITPDRICIYDLSTRKELHSWAIPEGSVASLTGFSPDGKLLLGICYGANTPRPRLWNTQTGKPVEGFKAPQGICRAAALSLDGKTMAVALEDDGIWVCDTFTGRKIRTLCPLSNKNTGYPLMTFASDGSLAAAMRDGTVVDIWDSATGEKKHTLHGHKMAITSLAFSANGKRLVSASFQDLSFRVWALPEGQERLVHEGIPGDANSVVLSPDGKTVAEGSIDNRMSIRRWDVETGKEIPTPDGNHYGVAFVAFTPNGKLVTSGANSAYDSGVRVWDPVTAQQLTFLDQKCLVGRMALSPDGKTVAMAEFDNVTHVWDLEQGKETRKFVDLPGMPDNVSFSPDSKTLIASYTDFTRGYTRRVFQFDLATGKRLSEEKRADTAVFSPDGKIQARVAKSVSLWDTASGKTLGEIKMETGQIRGASCACFSPDGTLFTIAWPGKVGDVLTRRVVGDFGGARCVAFSPDGRLLACGQDDGTIELWETLTWTLAGRRQGPRGQTLAVTFSPNGQLLASGHEDTSVLLWDIAGFFAPALSTPDKPAEIEALWSQLGSPKGDKGFQAVVALTRMPAQALPWVATHVKAVGTKQEPSVTKLLANLNHDEFGIRDGATQELARRGYDVLPALRLTLGANPSAEVKQRCEELLAKLPEETKDEAIRESRRVLRAIAVLERIGTTEARKILQEVAGGAADVWRTQEAKAALGRLARSPR